MRSTARDRPTARARAGARFPERLTDGRRTNPSHDLSRSARDGLQNDPRIVRPIQKIAFVDALAARRIAGGRSHQLRESRRGSADWRTRATSCAGSKSTRRAYPALIPNERGYDRAVESGVDAIALFTSATEHSARPISAARSTNRLPGLDPVVERALMRTVGPRVRVGRI